MHLFSISDSGELIKIDRLSFEENDVYLVDDEEKNKRPQGRHHDCSGQAKGLECHLLSRIPECSGSARHSVADPFC